MKRIIICRRLAVLAGALVAFALAATAQASAKTLIAGNNPATCPNADFVTIQAAIDASGPGDTVRVCPGTYPEQVRIVGHDHDGLKLESIEPLQAVIQWPTPETFPLALVDFNNADGVTLRAFTVTGPFTSAACSPDRHEGLLVENGFDERIVENPITLIRNSDPALYHCSEGDAVAIGRRTDPAEVFPPGSARVDHNLIDKYQKNGVQAVNTGTFVHAEHNVITGSSAVQSSIASKGVVVFRHAAAIEQNEISNNKFTPFPLSTRIILVGAPPGSSSIKDNFVHENDQGMEVDGESGLEISHNEVAGNRSAAITLCGTPSFGCVPLTDSSVKDNFVHGNGGWGLRLGGADNNLVKDNKIERNGGADSTNGISLVLGSRGNMILDNHTTATTTLSEPARSVRPTSGATTKARPRTSPVSARRGKRASLKHTVGRWLISGRDPSEVTLRPRDGCWVTSRTLRREGAR